jgi:hypothetical protein
MSAFEQPAVSGTVAAQDVDISPLLALSERAKGMVEGNVSGKFTFNVPDLDPAQLLKVMKLDGSVEMPRGQFTGFDLARKLGDISQMSGVSEVGPENTVFRDLAAEFALAGGTANLTSMQMALKHFDVQGAGTYSLDKSVNMRAEAWQRRPDVLRKQGPENSCSICCHGYVAAHQGDARREASYGEGRRERQRKAQRADTERGCG